jgi:hypothetical protein
MGMKMMAEANRRHVPPNVSDQGMPSATIAGGMGSVPQKSGEQS